MRDKRMIFLVPLAALSLIAGAYAFFWNPKRAATSLDDATGSGAGHTAEDPQLRAIQDLLSQLKAKLAIEPNTDADDEKQSARFPNLELLGTIVAKAKDPLAFIRDLDSSKQGVYRIGSTISGAHIMMIGPGNVLLEMNGETKNLRMAALRSHSETHDNPEGAADAIMASGENRFVVSRRGLTKSVDALASTLAQVSIKPYRQSENVIGMIVDHIPKNSLILAFGIQNKDVVTAVNKQKIDSYQKALQIAQKARSQTEITVNILREGQEKQVSYRFAP